MEEYQISAFIDDQLNLDEKIQLVEAVHADKAFLDEVLAYLYQEQKLRVPAVERSPALEVKNSRHMWSWGWFKQLGFYGCGLATALVVIFLFYTSTQAPSIPVAYRFILYQPEIQTVALVGSFSNWQALDMKPSGTSGYWEIMVELPPGEHRYSFLLDGHRRMTDPTSRMQEEDDFGSANSILTLLPRTMA